MLRSSDGAEEMADGFDVSLGGESGGSVTFGAPPASGFELFVLLNPAFTQNIQFDNGSAWLAEPVNEAADRSALRDLALKRDLDRGLRVPFGETPPPMDSLLDADGKVLAIVDGRLVPILNDAAGSEQVAASVKSAKAAMAKTLAAQTATEQARSETEAARDETVDLVAEAAAITQAVSDALAMGTISDLVGDRIYTSRAALNADLAPDDEEYALVVGDPTPANNDLYKKDGATTTGSWDGPLGIFAGASAEAQAIADSLSGLTTLVASTNLLDPTTIRYGKYVNTSSGNIASDANWACTAFIPCEEGDVFTVGGDGNRESGIGFFSAASDSGASVGASTGSLTVRTVTAPAGAHFVVFTVKSAARPIPANLRINRGDKLLPFEKYFTPYYAVDSHAVEPLTGGKSRLVLGGTGDKLSYVESNRSGNLIRNCFVPFPTLDLLNPPDRLNLREQWINGTLAHNGADDIAPDRIWGDDIGANHGFKFNQSTCVGHGKTVDDEGSIWSSGGNESVLVKVVDANTLLLARRTANLGPAVGAFTHVSGATNTSSFTTTANGGSIQWYPPHTNYSIRVLVDGIEVEETEGQWYYSDNVQIIETHDILARSEIIEWWIANGGASAGLTPDGDPSYTVTTTYHFDRDGQMSVLWNWVFLKETPVDYLRGIQLQGNNTPVTNYIPSAVPSTYEGNPVDFSLGESAFLTDGHSTLSIGADDLAADGEYADRVIVHWTDRAIAAGILPVGDAAPDLRRVRVTDTALEISNARKLYWRVLDVGTHNAQPGDSYSAIAYRHVMPRWAERVSFYVVRTQGRAFIFADWVDIVGLDRLPIPADLSGRTFSVVYSKNATVKAGVLAGSLPVMVDAADVNAYVVLEVSA
ncbi:hypothetical protein [Sphingopyxis sp. 113P3]|uniref:hypothetical protein n=1 Tax=Sphingopyxis sp. (strain 113P3) TaxID=292913 RepID=UPI0011875FFC|nr:hypothetical protein [Sphingopyxis sp. 113P3]